MIFRAIQLLRLTASVVLRGVGNAKHKFGRARRGVRLLRPQHASYSGVLRGFIVRIRRRLPSR